LKRHGFGMRPHHSESEDQGGELEPLNHIESAES
jgi:hypothetical protein